MGLRYGKVRVEGMHNNARLNFLNGLNVLFVKYWKHIIQSGNCANLQKQLVS